MAVKRTEKLPDNCGAIILAGGQGRRMGGEKQYLPIVGRPMLEHTAETFFGLKCFKRIVIVLGPDNLKLYGAQWKEKGFVVAKAGATRMESLRSGFKALGDVELVAVHDGARPLVSPELVIKTLKAAMIEGAAVPGVPLKDTVKRVSKDGAFFEETLDRSKIMAVQTPQCYRTALLDKILEVSAKGADYSDESQVLEKLGIKTAVVMSEYSNIKVTTPDDLIIAEAFMNKKKTTANSAPQMRFGFGYDIHRLVEGRALILGGVKIDHPKGMLGHSDGDVVLHSVCDALLGSVAAGEIGIYFPPTDLTIMGLSSSIIAEKVLEILKQKKASIVNVDVTIVAEEPKLKPHYENIRRSLAQILKLDLDLVSVKAKSREGLGDIGHGEAIVCYAVVGVLK